MATNSSMKGQSSSGISQITAPGLESGATFALHALQNAGQTLAAQIQSSGGPTPVPQISGGQSTTAQHSSGVPPIVTPVVTNPTIITGLSPFVTIIHFIFKVFY